MRTFKINHFKFIDFLQNQIKDLSLNVDGVKIEFEFIRLYAEIKDITIAIEVKYNIDGFQGYFIERIIDFNVDRATDKITFDEDTFQEFVINLAKAKENIIEQLKELKKQTLTKDMLTLKEKIKLFKEKLLKELRKI